MFTLCVRGFAHVCLCAYVCVQCVCVCVCLQRVFVHTNHHTVCALNLDDGPGWELSSSPSVLYFISYSTVFIDDKKRRKGGGACNPYINLGVLSHDAFWGVAGWGGQMESRIGV